jgi:hypothetical protein
MSNSAPLFLTLPTRLSAGQIFRTPSGHVRDRIECRSRSGDDQRAVAEYSAGDCLLKRNTFDLAGFYFDGVTTNEAAFSVQIFPEFAIGKPIGRLTRTREADNPGHISEAVHRMRAAY